MEKQRKTKAWQIRLLPLMTRMLIILTLFFFLASLIQLIYLHKRIHDSPKLKQELLRKTGIDKSLVALEVLTIEKRYHQANTSLMSRIWLKYLGFVTGMILTMIGATFILGKLNIKPTKIEIESEHVKLALLSSSPGIILAVLGTLIMIVTITFHAPIEVNDDSVYVRGIMVEDNNNHAGKQMLQDTMDVPDTTGPVSDRPDF